MKKIKLTEDTLRRIVKRVLAESEMPGNSEKKEETKPRCLPENTMPLDEIVGKAGDYIKYSPGIKKRSGGVNSMVDTLGILNNIRWTNDINDGGTHLAFEMMNGLNKFRNKNYYDEASGNCNKAMDKIIELYKENEHGTELVKDIEKVLALQTKDDQLTPSVRTKEYLKRALELAKGK